MHLVNCHRNRHRNRTEIEIDRPRTRPPRRLGDQAAVKRIVAILEEGLLAPVATLGEVVGQYEAGQGRPSPGLPFEASLATRPNCDRNS